MRFPISFYCLAMTLGLAAIGLIPAAQAGPQEALRAELERTDRLIGQAQASVSGPNIEAARFELDLALRIQAQARAALAEERFRIALDLTLRARSRALRVIAFVRGLPDPERVLEQLGHSQEMLRRSRDRIEHCDDDRAHALLGAAFEMQRRAAGAARAERFLAALQLTMSARERALRALRRCHLDEDPRESAGRALRRTDELIARAQLQVSESASEPARRMLSRAFELQDQAHGEFRLDHQDASLRLTQSARALAFRALRLSRGDR